MSEIKNRILKLQIIYRKMLRKLSLKPSSPDLSGDHGFSVAPGRFDGEPARVDGVGLHGLRLALLFWFFLFLFWRWLLLLFFILIGERKIQSLPGRNISSRQRTRLSVIFRLRRLQNIVLFLELRHKWRCDRTLRQRGFWGSCCE